MIKGKQAVLDYFDLLNSANDNNYIFFSIYRKGTVEKSNACITTPGDKTGWSYEQAKDFLSKWLDMQQYGEFTILLNDREQASARGGKRQDFSIEYAGNSNPVINGPSLSAEDIDTQVMKKVNEILDKKDRERELEELKKKVVELEKSNKELDKAANDPWTKVISGIEPYVPHILQDMGIIKTRVAGIPQSEATPVNKSEVGNADTDPVLQARLEKVVSKFFTARPDDWIIVLENLADAIEAKPSLGDKVHLIKHL